MCDIVWLCVMYYAEAAGNGILPNSGMALSKSGGVSATRLSPPKIFFASKSMLYIVELNKDLYMYSIKPLNSPLN